MSVLTDSAKPLVRLRRPAGSEWSLAGRRGWRVRRPDRGERQAARRRSLRVLLQDTPHVRRGEVMRRAAEVA